jgi:hypothetical protein
MLATHADPAAHPCGLAIREPRCPAELGKAPESTSLADLSAPREGQARKLAREQAGISGWYSCYPSGWIAHRDSI